MKLVRTILTTDFCPWANRYVYWMKQPLGWFAIAACAALLIGLFVSPQGWIMLACCLAVIAIQLAWPWVQIRACSCEVSFDRTRSEEWTENAVRLTVINRSFFPLLGLSIEQGFFLPESTDETDQSDRHVSITLSRVPPFSKNVYHWNFVPQRRGIYPVEPPRISTAFPFGIWTAHKPIEITNYLTIWPQSGRLSGLPVFPSQGIAPLGTMQDKAGDQGDVLGSRVWQPGESLRMVNWAQTARSEEDLIVIERQSCSRPNLQILLDLTPHPKLSRRRSIGDWQIRLHTTLIHFFHGHQFDLITGYANITKKVGSGKTGLFAWLDEVTLLDETKFDDRPLTPDGRQTQSLTTFIVTNTAGLQRLVERGLVPPNQQLIIVTIEGDDLAGIDAGRAIIIDLDHPHHDPFSQLAQHWRTHQRVEQSI